MDLSGFKFPVGAEYPAFMHDVWSLRHCHIRIVILAGSLAESLFHLKAFSNYEMSKVRKGIPV